MKLKLEITNDKLLYSWETSSDSKESCEMNLTAQGLVMFAHVLELCCNHRNSVTAQREREWIERALKEQGKNLVDLK